jgi:hypothetical protein
MVKTKKTKLVRNYILLLVVYLIAFPFGQLIRTDFSFGGRLIPIHPVDVFAGISISILFIRYDFSKYSKIFYPIFAVGLFSLLVSLGSFSPTQVFIGGLYLVRLFSYYCLFLTTIYIVKKTNLDKKILRGLLAALIIVAAIGWLQYLFIPDLRWLKYSGWDDHRDRLAGMFLDPGFTGIMLVFGFILSFDKFIKLKKAGYLLLTAFFGATTLLTYSRASYLALTVSISYYILKLKLGTKHFLVALFLIFLGIFMLPRPQGGEGVKLERVFSISSRLDNYVETLNVFQKYPVFGVGYNNICWERFTKNPNIEADSHSCFGSDSSLLLFLSTFGTVGLLILLGVIYKFNKLIVGGRYQNLLKTSLIAVLVHSTFSNSLFYPWVMGYLAILLALNLSSRE